MILVTGATGFLGDIVRNLVTKSEVAQKRLRAMAWTSRYQWSSIFGFIPNSLAIWLADTSLVMAHLHDHYRSGLWNSRPGIELQNYS